MASSGGSFDPTVELAAGAALVFGLALVFGVASFELGAPAGGAPGGAFSPGGGVTSIVTSVRSAGLDPLGVSVAGSFVTGPPHADAVVAKPLANTQKRRNDP